MVHSLPSAPTRTQATGTSLIAGPISPGVKPFGYILVASSMMSYVPAGNIGTGTFVAVLGCALLYLIANVRPTIADGRTLATVLFVLYALASVFNLMSNGWGISEWTRGVLPFVFFLLAVFLPTLTTQDRRWLTDALFFAGLCWLIRILLTAVYLRLFKGSNVFSERLTFDVVDAVLPYPLMMVPYLLFVKSIIKPWLRWVILLVLLYVYVWIGYRAGLALISVPLLVYFIERFRRLNFLSIMLVVLGFFLFYRYGVFGSFELTDRFQRLDDDASGARSMEWAYAFDSFRDSPIIGKGVGWQVPGSVTFFGLEQNEGSDVAYVGYVHSSLAYMAMTMGVVGIALYFFIVLPRFRPTELLRGEWFAFLSLLLITIFCLTQASYRTIQTVLMLIALIRLNAPNLALSARSRIAWPSEADVRNSEPETK